MKKQYILLCLLLAALVAGVLLYLGREPEAPPRAPKIPPVADHPPTSKGLGPPWKAKGPAPTGLLPVVTMKPAQGVPATEVRYQYRLDVPYRCWGGGGVGTLKDREGNILMESGKDLHIFDVALSPDDSLILVEGGDARNLVLNPATGEKTPLPQVPPGEHVLGLSWHWLGKELLIAEGGNEEPNAPRGDEPVIAQSRLYTYDLRRREFREVALPPGLPVKVFGIKEASYDGHVNLISDSTPEGIDPDLGWFKIEAPP